MVSPCRIYIKRRLRVEPIGTCVRSTASAARSRSNQKYLGTAETILAKIEEAERAAKPARLKTESFGAIFVAHCLEQELDTIGIIDGIIPIAEMRRVQLSVNTSSMPGQTAWLTAKKRASEDWYRMTAVQHIRPVDLSQSNCATGKMGSTLRRTN